MSLINQVLRDLDKRQAAKGEAAPGAVKTPKRPPTKATALQRAGRWGIGIVATGAAVVMGGVAQGSIQWPGQQAVVAAPTSVPMPVPAPVAVAVPAPAVIQLPEPQQVTRVAVAAPASRSAVVAPRSEPKISVRDLPTLPASPVPAATARIDKRMSERTPQERAEAHYQRGVIAHQAGQINDSADAFIAALREDPRYAPARQAQAGLLIGQSRLDEALALLQEGIALTPQQPTLALMLARLQAERHDVNAAADTLKLALPAATRNAEYLGFHAAILQRAGRHGEATEQFGAALRLAPANSVWWMGLGISLAAAGQNDAAREAFMRAKTTGALPAEAGQYVELRLRQLL